MVLPWRVSPGGLTFSGRKIAFFSGAAEALYLRQITTVGSTIPLYLHGYRKHPMRGGFVRKFNLRRLIRDNCFDADRFFYASAPAAVIDWPIEIDYKPPLAQFGSFDWVFQSRISTSYDASPSGIDLVPGVIEMYRSGAFNLRVVLSPLAYEVARSVSFSVRVSPKPYLTLTLQITVGELCLDKVTVDRTCSCTSFLTHLPEEPCDHQVFYRGTWVEFDESMIFAPARGPAPQNAFLREVRGSKHSRITRFSELTDESQTLFQNLLLCLQTFDLWEHFNLIEDFLLDAGFPAAVARDLALDPEGALVEYCYT